MPKPMTSLAQIPTSDMLTHVAIIMDGNGRWAQSRQMKRTQGHQQGVATVERIVEASVEMGVKYLTLYAFSTENWTRPKEEVDFLFSLLAKNLLSKTKKIKKQGIRFCVLGDLKKVPFPVRQLLKHAVKDTRSNDVLTLNVAVNYSARWDILNAVKGVCTHLKKNELDIKHIDDMMFNSFLSTAGIPDPDLLIRTGGEQRISNFLLYQIAYSELCFTDTCWPDFSKEEYKEMLLAYTKRNRTFGSVK